MPRRNLILATGEIYHVFNRGVEKRPLFTNNREFQQFFERVEFYQRNRSVRFSYLSGQQRQEIITQKQGSLLVEIVCYCLMPNHFHFILKQASENGIKEFIRKSTDSYGKYFNLLHDRSGPLFQGHFKAVRIETDSQLLHVSRYIHINPLTAHLVKKPEDYHWSSYSEYLGLAPAICSQDIILDQFRTRKAYQKFVVDLVDFNKKLENLEHLLLEKEP